jgi:phenylacetate-CoA ligase
MITPDACRIASPTAAAVIAGDRGRVAALSSQMMARERWPRERLLEYQRDRVREMVAHAVTNSPYYRAVLGPAAPVDIRLEELPVLGKTALMNEFDRIVTDPRLRLADVLRHLAGEQAGDPLFGEYRLFATGGATGERAVVAYDRTGWEIVIANVRRWLAVMGVRPDGRNVGIGAPTPLHLTNRVFREIQAGESGPPRLTVIMPTDEIVAALNAYQPELLLTYPSIIRRLLEEQGAGRLRIAPRLVCSTAETVTDEVRAGVQNVWGVTLFDGYGTTETGVIGMECPNHSGIHVAEDLLVYEVVDHNNRPVPPGTRGDKVLVTVLFNRVMPLIRYEISDLVVAADDACACGRPHRRLAMIDGRGEDVLELPARGGGRVSLHALRLRGRLLRLPDVRQFDVAPQASGIRIRVVLRDAARRETALLEVRRAVAEELERAGAVVESLTVDAVERIERAGAGAKEKLVRPPIL